MTLRQSNSFCFVHRIKKENKEKTKKKTKKNNWRQHATHEQMDRAYVSRQKHALLLGYVITLFSPLSKAGDPGNLWSCVFDILNLDGIRDLFHVW